MSEQEKNEKFLESQKGFSTARKELTFQDSAPWRNDILGRKVLAEKLIRLIDGETKSVTIGINGAWGSGKTFFLKRLRANLENDGFSAIYFNAWEDDFYSDPLVALLGQVSKHFDKEASQSFSEKISENLEAMKSAVEKLWPSVLSEGIRIETGMKLNIENWIEALISGENKILRRYAQHGESRKLLKDNLQELAKTCYEQNGKPLVFIIDELDRCRPTFAIELLERVKHIFDVENIVFILGINKEPLGKSIRSVYGEIDSDVYLRRFFNFEFSLPKADLKAFCQHLIQRHQLELIFRRLGKVSRGDQYFEADIGIFERNMPQFFGKLDLSLRDLDDIIRSLVVIAKTCDESGRLLSYAVVPLLVMKQKDEKLYEKIIEGQTPFIEVFNYVTDQMKLVPGEIEPSLSSSLQIIEAACYLMYPNGEQQEVVSQLRKIEQRITNNVAGDTWSDVDRELMSSSMHEGRNPREILEVCRYINSLETRDWHHLNLAYIQKHINLV